MTSRRAAHSMRETHRARTKANAASAHAAGKSGFARDSQALPRPDDAPFRRTELPHIDSHSACRPIGAGAERRHRASGCDVEEMA
jgi:hypothetical protein